MITAHAHRRTLARRRGWRSGNAIIEMAVVFPVLLWLAMGMAEFGQYFYIRSAFVSAARDGCRRASLSSATQAIVVSTMTTTLAQANVTYNSSWATFYDINQFGQTVAVTDITTIPSGDGVEIQLNAQYSSIPNAYRPLYQITGKGIGTGKMISTISTMVKN